MKRTIAIPILISAVALSAYAATLYWALPFVFGSNGINCIAGEDTYGCNSTLGGFVALCTVILVGVLIYAWDKYRRY
jgi:hypothetical protein